MIKKIWFSGKAHIKFLLVFAAFSILVLSSFFIMTRSLSGKLSKNVEETANDMQDFLSSKLADPERALYFIAGTIQGMIRRGEDLDAVQAYLAECSSDEFKEKIHTASYGSIFGYLDIYDMFFDGADWTQPEGYSAKDRPWYTGAVDNHGEIAISKVFMDARLNIPSLFYSCCIFDSDGGLLGVIGMNVSVAFVQQLITSGHFTENSYGYIMDEQLTMLIHPEETLIGEHLIDVNPNFAQVDQLIKRGGGISMYRIRDYRGIKSLMFSRRLHNGWHINFMVPENEYYKELYEMMVIISVLGAVMASALALLLVSIDAARNKADMENRQKSNFLAVMSHEIRTPMNAIMGIAESRLHEQNEAISPAIKEAFDRIYYSGNLLLQIINDLLDLSKIESGKLDITHEKYEVASLINEVVHINKIRFDNKPIEFKLSVDESIPATLIGDELRIKQILNNLLSNAFKYTWKGEVELKVELERENDAPGGVMLIFTVRDTGQGISQQDMKNLFHEYARFNIEANRSTVGTGLGLSITRNLVGMMGGEISAESEFEKGSVFTVRLPQKTNGSSAVLGKAVADNLSRHRFSSVTQMKKTQVLREYMPYGSVLIVDDIEMNSYVAKLLMGPYGL